MLNESSENMRLPHLIFEFLCVELIEEFFIDLNHHKLFFRLNVILKSVCTKRDTVLFSLLSHFLFDLRGHLSPIAIIISQVPDEIFHDEADRTFTRLLLIILILFYYILDDFGQLLQKLRWHLANVFIGEASIQIEVHGRHYFDVLFALFIAFCVGALKLFLHFRNILVFLTSHNTIHLLYNVLDVIMDEALHLLFSLLPQKELHVVDILVFFQRVKCIIRSIVTITR